MNCGMRSGSGGEPVALTVACSYCGHPTPSGKFADVGPCPNCHQPFYRDSEECELQKPPQNSPSLSASPSPEQPGSSRKCNPTPRRDGRGRR